MEISSNNYLDFAKNDYMFFRTAYDTGNKGGTLTIVGQNICQCYIKHIISEYSEPENRQEMDTKESVLRTHSLNRLMHYCVDYMNLSIPEELENALILADSYYFTSRYPGEDSFIPTERDVEKVNTAVELTREYTLQVCREFDFIEQDMEQEIE